MCHRQTYAVQQPGAIAVGTLIAERPPHRTVRAAFPHTACMGLSLSRVHHAIFCRALSFHSFVRPAPRAFFRPDRIFPSPSCAAAVKDGASSAPPTACMGLVWGFLRQGCITPFFVVLCHSILLFDPRREHSSVPTAYFHRRRAQRRSRAALLQRRRRLVLDGREHGGRVPGVGWCAAR